MAALRLFSAAMVERQGKKARANRVAARAFLIGR